MKANSKINSKPDTEIDSKTRSKKKSKLFPVTIKRKYWLRNNNQKLDIDDDYDSGLRIGSKQCCLGFIARAHGYKARELENYAYPCNLDNWEDRFLVGLDRSTQRTLASINDSFKSNDAQKEKQIKRILRDVGYKVVFVD